MENPNMWESYMINLWVNDDWFHFHLCLSCLGLQLINFISSLPIPLFLAEALPPSFSFICF